MLFNSDNKIISLYENNQLCILDYKYIKENEVDNNIIKTNISKIKIQYLKEPDLIVGKDFKVIECSAFYENKEKYGPSMLFRKESYYCSSEGTVHFFELDFLKEYFFFGFRIEFHGGFIECIPKNYNIQLYDEKKRAIRELAFTSDIKHLYENKIIDEKARYIRFIFINNFDGKYIIIKRIKFTIKTSNNII